jgi:hypothetical protein
MKDTIDGKILATVDDLPEELHQTLAKVTTALSDVLCRKAMEYAMTAAQAVNIAHVAGAETIACMSLSKAVMAVIVNYFPPGCERAGVDSAIIDLQTIRAEMDDPAAGVSVFIAEKQTAHVAAAGGVQ